MPTSSDPPRPSRGAPPISLDNPPPDWRPDEEDQDQEIGVLVVVQWEMEGTTLRSKVTQSPPYRRRYWPWLKEVFDRIQAAERDRILNRAMKPPKSEGPKPR